MELSFKNFIIRDLIKALNGNHATYWKLYAMKDEILLQLYELIVPVEQQRVTLKNFASIKNAT